MSMTNKSELAISFSAMIIALAAMVTTVWQSMETRNHNRLSVAPKLVVYSNSTKFLDSVKQGVKPGIFVENHGLGPAIVENVRVYVNGSLKPDDGYNGWKAAIKDLNINYHWVRIYGFSDGDAIREDRQFGILHIVPGLVNSKNLLRFSKAMEQVRVEIDYESIYGEKFTVEFPR